MLTVTTGPFHPDLEHALVADLRRLKADDPLAPAAVIVPSDSLRRRLAWLLSVEQRFPLLDVPILTFHQLALRLLAEAGSGQAERLRSDFFFRQLIARLLRAPGEDARWQHLAPMPGAWAALWGTLKDLKDAAVDADRVLEALEPAESPALPFFEQPLHDPDLAGLVRLYARFRRQQDDLCVWDADDLARHAVDSVSGSPFLVSRRRLFYYGFYDLTQVQLDLFQSITRACPVSLYFPLVDDDPAFEFARRVFSRYVVGQATSSPCATPAHPRRPPVTRVLHACGRYDEIAMLAKDILTVVEERGVAFEDIGVVARSLAGYEHLLPRLFRQHGIPFVSTLGRPLASLPYVKAVLQLLEARVSELPASGVLSLLASPYLRLSQLGVDGGRPRPDLWQAAVRRLGIRRGRGDWRRLEAFLDRGLPLREDLGREVDEAWAGPSVPAEQLRTLHDTVLALEAAVGRLPGSATWAGHVQALQELCTELLDADDDEADPQAASTIERFAAACQELEALGELEGEVDLAEFISTLRRLAEETLTPIGSQPGTAGGVQVLEAMAARGLPFRVLYLLGMNEKRFPRHIQEDAFLRDRARRFLEADLGFKIQEKLAGYDEEQLLFALLCRAACEQLTLLYQRSDEQGRPLVPSGYLEPLLRSTAAVAVPRRLTAKLGTLVQYALPRLTPAEAAAALLLQRRLPGRWLEQHHPAGAFLAEAIVALREQERVPGPLGPHDGLLGPMPAYWDSLCRQGLSPSALEEYATCPFRYLARHVWQVEWLTDEREEPVGPLERGTLVHDILRRCYQELQGQGVFRACTGTTEAVLAAVRAAAAATYARFAESNAVGRTLLWDLECEAMTAFLERIVVADVLAMVQEGWEPILFEVPLQGELPIEPAASAGRVGLRGRLDRVDWAPTCQRFRVIDYKYKSGREPDTLDLNLPLGAVRGLRLQPPLYLAMANAVTGLLPSTSAELRCEGVWFYYLAPQWDAPLQRVGFPADAWRSPLAVSLRAALGLLLDGIREGRFFIFPDSSRTCSSCDYRLACRRTSRAAVWRSRRDVQVVKPYRDLRRARLPRKEDP